MLYMHLIAEDYNPCNISASNILQENVFPENSDAWWEKGFEENETVEAYYGTHLWQNYADTLIRPLAQFST